VKFKIRNKKGNLKMVYNIAETVKQIRSENILVEDKNYLMHELSDYCGPEKTLICQYCGRVDHDMERMRVGYPTECCGRSSPCGESYFSMVVLQKICNLIVEQAIIKHYNFQPFCCSNPDSVTAATFFQTLVEILFKHFLYHLWMARNKPSSRNWKEFNDEIHKGHRYSWEKWFPKLTGDEFDTAIKNLN
jgi:hypothetical protein